MKLNKSLNSPKDLGVKILPKEEAFWAKIIEARKEDIESSKNNIKYFEAIIEIAEIKLKQLRKKP